MYGNSLQTLQPLEPLPYQLQIRDFLMREEAEIWNWYRSAKFREEQAEAVRFELLKATYRVDRESQPRWYDAAEEAAAKLGLDGPLTIYQAQNPEVAVKFCERQGSRHTPCAVTLQKLRFLQRRTADGTGTVPATLKIHSLEGMNAGLAFLPGEGHLVLSGPI